MTELIFKKLETGFETPEYRWSAMLNPPAQATKKAPAAQASKKAPAAKAPKAKPVAEKKVQTKKASS